MAIFSQPLTWFFSSVLRVNSYFNISQCYSNRCIDNSFKDPVKSYFRFISLTPSKNGSVSLRFSLFTRIGFWLEDFGLDIVYLPVKIGSSFEAYLSEIIFAISLLLFSQFSKVLGLAIWIKSPVNKTIIICYVNSIKTSMKKESRNS